MYLKLLEDNLRSCLETAMYFSELQNCADRIQEILILPESVALSGAKSKIQEKGYESYYGISKELEVENMTFPRFDPIILSSFFLAIPSSRPRSIAQRK